MASWNVARVRAVDEHIGFYRDQICKLSLNFKPTLPPSPEDVLTI